jgi:hypothetical protein
MFKVSPASLQISIDTSNCVLEDRVQYSTVHIPNVFCDGHRQVHRYFWSPCLLQLNQNYKMFFANGQDTATCSKALF